MQAPIRELREEPRRARRLGGEKQSNVGAGATGIPTAAAYAACGVLRTNQAGSVVTDHRQRVNVIVFKPGTDRTCRTGGSAARPRLYLATITVDGTDRLVRRRGAVQQRPTARRAP
jgi:hypothetical protein